MIRNKFLSPYYGLLGLAFSLNSYADCPTPSVFELNSDGTHFAMTPEGKWTQKILGDVYRSQPNDNNFRSHILYRHTVFADNFLFDKTVENIQCTYLTRNNGLKTIILSAPQKQKYIISNFSHWHEEEEISSTSHDNTIHFIPRNGTRAISDNTDIRCEYPTYFNREDANALIPQEITDETREREINNLTGGVCKFIPVVAHNIEERETLDQCTSDSCNDNQRPEFFRQMKFPTSYKAYEHKLNDPVTLIDSKAYNLPTINLHATFDIRRDVIDTPIYRPNLPHQNEGSDFIHGTAMASIIGSSQYSSSNGQSFIGVLPRARIWNRIVMPNKGYPLSFINAISAVTTDREYYERIFNVSGGNKGTGNAQVWNILLKSIGEGVFKRLIIAAVGNDARNISLAPNDQQIWPAAYKPKKIQDIINDPVIRVAALQFDDNGYPSLYSTPLGTGSRYGAGRVDIGAPGKNIQYLTPQNTIGIGNGTSEATAIVTGVVAAMRACSSELDLTQIKKALLDTADKHDHLKDKITEGRVLNAKKALEAVCSPVESIELYNSIPHPLL